MAVSGARRWPPEKLLLRKLLLGILLLGITWVSGCDDGSKVPPLPGNSGVPALLQSDLPGDATEQTAVATGVNRPNPPPEGVIPRFRAHGAESGFDFTRNDDIRGRHHILEANGGGVGLIDYDNDGLHDILMTNGCRLPLKERDCSTPSQLFANLGGFQFRQITERVRLIECGFATGCAVADFDADGFDDLYIAALGPDHLWQNNGDGTFSDVSLATGISAPAWGASVAFADLNHDGHLDLYIVNYLVESDETPRECPNADSPDGVEQCPPAMFDGAADVVYFSDGAGQFVDVTEAVGLGSFKGKGLGIVVCDFDQNGRQDVYIANDGQANFLFVSEPVTETLRSPGGEELPLVRFEDRALESGCALSEAGYAQAGMGIAAGDYDGNGSIDLFLTHFYADTNTTYANRGGLIFEDVTRTNCLGAASRTKLGFGTIFCDVDNDNWLDVIVANGHIDDRTWLAHEEPYRMRPQIFRNLTTGNFVETTEWSGDYFQTDWLGRGLAAGDFNRDGRIDMVISHQLAPSLALQNETQVPCGAMTIRLVGTKSNRTGLHTKVSILDAEKKPTVFRELSGGGSFQSASATEIQLACTGNADKTIRILWPSGLTEEYPKMYSGQWIAIEGQGILPIAPRSFQ